MINYIYLYKVLSVGIVFEMISLFFKKSFSLMFMANENINLICKYFGKDCKITRTKVPYVLRIGAIFVD